MEDNKDVVSSTETEQVEKEATIKNPEAETIEPKERMYSRGEVNKIVNAERMKIKDEVRREMEAEKTEAEKLARMDAEQKLSYELEKEREKNKLLETKFNSISLQNQANTYADSKGLPLGYIEDIDYTNETADSIMAKIDKLVELRSQDLDGYIKEKLKQEPPKAIDETIKTKTENDPYVKGYKDYKKK